MSYLFGAYGLGLAGFGYIEEADDPSAPTGATSLPQSENVYLFDISSIKISDDSLVTFRYSTSQYPIRTTWTDPELTIAEFYPYRPRIQQPPDLNRRLGLLTRALNSLPTIGAVNLLNKTGDLDSLFTDYAYDSRNIVVRAGGKDWPISNFREIFRGKLQQCLATENNISFVVADFATKLDTQLQTNTYEGSGGFEGTEELKGRPKPILLGKCRNIQPVLVDPANLIYQVHHTAIQAVDALYVNGVTWTYVASSPTSGQWTYNASTGRITLGGSTPPSGIVTVDVRGDSGGGYVDTISGIVDRLLRNYADFEDGDLGNLSTWSGTTGFYFTDEITIQAAMDEIARRSGSWWGMNRSGRVEMYSLGSGIASGITITEDDIFSISCQEAPTPVYKVKVGYGRTWRVMSNDEVAAGVSSALERQRLTNEFSWAVAELSAVKTRSPLAAEMIIESNLDSETAAQNVADIALTYFSKYHKVWQVTIPITYAPDIEVGRTITVQHSRFGLDDGVSFFIDGYSENYSSGQITLTLVGSTNV